MDKKKQYTDVLKAVAGCGLAIGQAPVVEKHQTVKVGEFVVNKDQFVTVMIEEGYHLGTIAALWQGSMKDLVMEKGGVKTEVLRNVVREVKMKVPAWAEGRI